MQSFWKAAGDLLNIEKASDLVEKAKAAALDVAEAASKVSDTVQAEYRRTFVDLDCQIWKLKPNFMIMEFPSQTKIDRLATRLNADYAQRMLILNMSEHKYDTGKFFGEVMDVAFRGLPAPPVELLLELLLSSHQWLASDPTNVVVVHCYEGFTRSAVLGSCFLTFRGFHSHPLDALPEVCHEIAIGEGTILPSQKRYMGYFQQVLQGFVPWRGRLRLQRVRLNCVPTFESEGSVRFRPLLEVWCGGELVYTSFSPSKDSGGEGKAQVLPQSYGASDTCVSFQLPVGGLDVSGDVLMRVRHVSAAGDKDTALRLTFHSGFVSDALQAGKKELDCANTDARFPEESFLEVTFEKFAEEGGAAAQVLAVYSKAKEVAQKLRAEELERQEQEAALLKAARQDQQDQDEVAKLEATLLRAGGTGTSASSTARPGAAASVELQRALAEAAAEEAPAEVAVLNSGSATPASVAPSEPAASPQPPRVAAGPAAPAAVPNGSIHSPPPSSKADDIDQLFSEFDAALDSAAAAAPAPRAQASSGQRESPPGSTRLGNSDVFADVDAFLEELDGGLKKGARK